MLITVFYLLFILFLYYLNFNVKTAIAGEYCKYVVK